MIARQYRPEARNPYARTGVPTGSAAQAYGADAAARIRAFVPMVRRLAWHLAGGGRGGVEVDDLMQAGLVALTECARRHDRPDEDGFAAYAKLRVRGAMVDLIRREVPAARGVADRRRQLRGAETTLAQHLGRAPAPAELAEALGVTAAELAAMQSAAEPPRFEPLDDAYDERSLAFADPAPDAETLLADGETRAALIAAIGALPQRLQLVTQLYFVEELNLAEIAEVLSVSIPRVHQLKAQALAKLREALAEVVEVA